MSVLCEILKKRVIWQFKVKCATIFNVNIEDQKKAYYKKEIGIPTLMHFQIPKSAVFPYKFMLLIAVYYSRVVTFLSI